MKKYINTSLTLLITALGIVFLASCGGNEERKEHKLIRLKEEYAALGQKIKALETELAALDTTRQKTKDVFVATVTPQLFEHFIDIQGAVDARENVQISPKTAGVVKRILVKEGQSVSAGQVLAEMDSDIYQTQIATVMTQLGFATELFDRQKKLWDQKVGSEVQYLQAKNNKEALEKQLATLNEQLDMTRIRSIINGTVDAISIKLGQMASPQMPAFRVVNYNDMRVVAHISEVYSSKVNSGNAVKVNFPDLKKEMDSKITFASKVIDPLKRTFDAEVAIVGDKAEFRPNMMAIMRIVDYTNEKAIVLPINNIQSKDGQSYVYTIQSKDGKDYAVRTPIQQGIAYNGMVEITHGLKPDDRIVTSGQFDLVDGMQVIIRQ